MRKQLRAKKRIEADKQRKLQKRIQEQKAYTYEEVYRFKHFVQAYPKSRKGVSWKPSVQKYSMSVLSKLYNDYISIINGELPKLQQSKKIVRVERGKNREIVPIHFKDRIIQKVLCDNCLTPIITKLLIYDNGASLPGKGVNFTRKRLLRMLNKAKREYNNDFYVLSFDFKKFFDNVSHQTCRNILERYIVDKRIVDVTMETIKAYQFNNYMYEKDYLSLDRLNNDKLKGMCLGSQVSQLMALIVPNALDHFIKDQKGMKYYCRYMDDGVIFAKTKEELWDLYEGMKEVCENLQLTFNENKTKIVHIKKGFTFLKVKYNITLTGKIVRRLTHDGIVRMRRKLKKFKKLVNNGRMSLDDVYNSFQSWMEHSSIANSHKTVQNMLKLYDELFDGYKITKRWKQKGGNSDVLLQNSYREKYSWSDYRN